MHLGFQVHGYAGSVQVAYETEGDPDVIGFDLVAGYDDPDHPDGLWVAETFLSTAPDIARTKRVMPVVGFRWGYELTDGRPTSLRPAAIGADRWNAVRKVLAAQYADWRFLDWAAS